MFHGTHRHVLVLVLIAIGVLALPALAAPPRTPFTSTGTPDYPVDPRALVPLGGSYYLLGFTQTGVEQSTDPRISGTATDILYGILGPDLTGPMWGTVTIKNDHGAWTGYWQGGITREGADTIATAEGTLVGSGDYAGLIAFVSGRTVNDGARQGTGYISKGKVVERPMKLNSDGLIKVDMRPANWTWLAPNMATIPWTMEDTGISTHLGDFKGRFSGGTLMMFLEDGSAVTLAQWSDGELIAANGDKIFIFQWPADLQDQTMGYATIRGGTGRFANATGSMVWTGHIDPDDWWEGGFHFFTNVKIYEGTITY